jgi:hypothetical protein
MKCYHLSHLARLKPARGQKNPATSFSPWKIWTKVRPPHLSGSTTRGCENSRGIGFFRSDTRKSRPIQEKLDPAEKPSSTLLISNLPQYDYSLVNIEYCKIHRGINQKLVQILSEPIKIKQTRLDEIVLLTNTKIQIEETCSSNLPLFGVWWQYNYLH